MTVYSNDTRNHTQNQFSRLLDWIRETYPDGRERSLAITKLQEAGMWLEKAALPEKKTENK